MSHDVETFEIVEETTPDYVVTLLGKADDNGVQPVIPGSVLDSLTLTYFQEYTEEIINSRNYQNVLQVNGVTINEQGELRWTLSQADAVIVDDSLHQEPHIAQFRFTYPGVSGEESSSHRVRILVANLVRVPS
jgi:hypothetical protein